MPSIHLVTAAIAVLGLQQAGPTQDDSSASDYADTFDTHWEALRAGYPYFELYGVDWAAERAEHRPRAVAATNSDEFTWELARLIASLPDPHVSFIPALDSLVDRWSYPEVDTMRIGRKLYVLAWPEEQPPDGIPNAYVDGRHAYPEIIELAGVPPIGAAEILAAGPLGSTVEIRLRWPDGSESGHRLRRPDESNLTPKKKHFGDEWLVTGRAGNIGYMGVRTFDPKIATLGPDGKMTTMLRAALRELGDTEGLILDFQGNGGGLVAASDPFLGNLIERRMSYAWGNSNGKRRVITPRRPRYDGAVVALVDERSASGGEWAARILRDAGRATVVGGRTQGAEAAVHTSTGPDGSVVHYSAWPMVEPGVRPFQEVGIERDHACDLTIEDVRAFGHEEARLRVRRARIAKAVELLGGGAADVDALDKIAGR